MRSRLQCLPGSKRRKPNKKALVILEYDQSGRLKSVSQVMKNKLKSARSSSKSAAASQSKTAHSRAEVYLPPPAFPSIALFPKGNSGVAGETIGLSKAQYAALKRAFGDDSGILWFMAKAALERTGQPSGAGNTPAPHGTRAPSSTPEESGFITGGIVVNLADTAGNEVGSVKIDDADAELLQKAAAASELKLTELLHFIVLRQLEAFFPPEVEGLYRVSDNAIHEISSGFESAQQHVETLWAVAVALVERVGKERSLVSPADYCAAISELKVLSSLIEDLAVSARIEVADANSHWHIAGCPALLEQHVAPVSIPSTRVAA